MMERICYSIAVMFAVISVSIFSCGLGQEEISYSEHIKPILNKKCLRCHGGIRQQGGFSLLFEEEALSTSESGKLAIIPGHAQKSELIKRIKSTDPDIRMPQEGEPCSKEEISLLEAWIDQGAKWDEHWSYKPFDVSPLGQTSDDSSSVIDHFISVKLDDLGLHLNPKAQPSDLARRVSLDLTGLPPDIEQVEPYLGNPTLAQYGKMVDQLLASPHYGERLANMWLDLARYADSKGYEKDDHRSIWKYRDWLINAFNRDLPFDQFTVDQLAGDLVDQPTRDQLIATAFHRNTMTNDEGGTEDEEYRSAAVVDRVNTTFEIWQGTTMSCVQCHSHPYDPIKHDEYYRVYALFNNTQDADLGNEFPYALEATDSLSERRLKEIAEWIAKFKGAPHSVVDLGREEIATLVFPRLFGDLATDYQEILVHSDGSFRNSAMNANNQKTKQYLLLYQNITLDELTQIKFMYHAEGDDVLVNVYADSIGGPLLLEADLKNTKSSAAFFDERSFPVQEAQGKRDLIFHFVNTTGEFSTGVAWFKEMELVYDRSRLPTQLRRQQDSLLNLYRKGTRTPIMMPKSELLNRVTHVHERGNYLAKGEKVQPGVPHVFNPNGKQVSNRLELARWLVHSENALTARVIVNRVWELIFGNGLVETLEDFGSQGSLPTHPQLLDHLAYQFSSEWKWSLKKLVRAIVHSKMYQQSVHSSPEKQRLDPFNRYYSRSSRTRLSAEQIRDQALAISGLLSRKIGGPSVMPPQPEQVWQVVYSNAKWVEATGADRYRRGLYTYWKRTTPYPSMVAFDSPSREFCVSRRIRTNTPLQALVTLNDTVYLEAADALAKWMMSQSAELQEAISLGYKKALLKDPDQETVRVLMDLYERANKPQAIQVANIEVKKRSEEERLEPMVVVANTIMNLDAFLTKS